MSLGWLTESAQLPRKAIEIDNVHSGSMLDLQAAYYQTQIDAHNGISSSRKKIPQGGLSLKKNSGVEERNRRDKLFALREENGQENLQSLQKKAKVYDQLVHGDVVGQSKHLLIDFEQKGWDIQTLKESNVWDETIYFNPGTIGFQFSGSIISHIYPNTQASEAGIKVGWKIREINDEQQVDTTNFIKQSICKAQQCGKQIKILFNKNPYQYPMANNVYDKNINDDKTTCILNDLDELRSERKLWENAALEDIRTANKTVKNKFPGNSRMHILPNKKCLSSTEKDMLKNIQNDTFKVQENNKKEQAKKK